MGTVMLNEDGLCSPRPCLASKQGWGSSSRPRAPTPGPRPQHRNPLLKGAGGHAGGGLGSRHPPGKMKMKKELTPPMMPMISLRSGRNRAMASVTATHRMVSSTRTPSPEGSARALGPRTGQQLLLQKSCITDLEARPAGAHGLRGCSPALARPGRPTAPPSCPVRRAGLSLRTRGLFPRHCARPQVVSPRQTANHSERSSGGWSRAAGDQAPVLTPLPVRLDQLPNDPPHNTPASSARPACAKP